METSIETPVEPTIHEAELASGPSGAVIWGPLLSQEQAVARRQRGHDIIVRGEALADNRRVAREVESAVAPAELHQPH